MSEERQTYGISPGTAAEIEDIQPISARARYLGRIDHGLPHQLGTDRTHDGHCATGRGRISDSVLPMHDQSDRPDWVS